MKSNLIKDLRFSEIKRSVSGRKVIEYAESIANGVPKSKSSDESNIFWHRWKEGDNTAMDAYVRSNVWLFTQIAFELKTRYFSMDIQDIFSIVLGFTKEAFEGYDSSNKATLISYHSHYAQYRVSHTFEAMSPISYKHRKLLREAKRLSFEEDLNLHTALSNVLEARKMYKYQGAGKAASKIIGLSKPLDSLDRSISLERDSMTLADTVRASKEDIDYPLDSRANRQQIERIKRYISRDLNSEEMEMFSEMLKGSCTRGLAKEKGVTRQCINYIQKSIKRKLAFRVKQLKAKGVKLPEQF